MPCLWFLSPGPLKREDGKVAAVDFDGMSVTSPGAEKLPKSSGVHHGASDTHSLLIRQTREGVMLSPCESTILSPSIVRDHFYRFL